MEGLLQSFKFDKAHIQVEVCKLIGISAKIRGKARNTPWQRKQCLWWDGMEIPRHSLYYQDLLTEAFDSLYSHSEKFRRALAATGDAVLRHSLGSKKESETVLTEREFVNQLHRLRNGN